MWLQGLGELKNLHMQDGSYLNYRNAMAYLFKSDPGRNLANVFLENDFCISCFFEVRLLKTLICKALKP